MRVVELMKRRCRRVLEWAAAVTVTVTVFHCILQLRILLLFSAFSKKC